jgi:hypothetical protein
MKSLTVSVLLAALSLAAVPASAEVRQVEIDVAGYLCGL